MALRPRVSPGVPLSWAGAPDLEGGTRPVKHRRGTHGLARSSCWPSEMG